MSSKLIFSIYKYRQELILEEKDINYEEFVADSNKYIDNSVSETIQELKKHLEHKNIECIEFNQGVFSGIYFYSSNEPIWKNFIEQIVKNNEDMIDFNVESNNAASYILFIKHKKSIYILTGGNGARYIKNYIESYFGIDLLPGLVKDTDSSVKSLDNTNFYGDRLSQSFINSNLTRIRDEKNMRSLYKNLNVEIPLKKLEETLGISILENENENKIIRVENKDSIVIRRSITLNELTKVIKNIDDIYETKRNNYILNYFIPAHKRNIKKTDIENQLIIEFVEKRFENFKIIGDSYSDYYLSSDKYILKDGIGNIVLEKENEEITLENCFELFKDEKIQLNKTFMKVFLKKWTISTENYNGDVQLYPVSIINVLQGNMDLNLVMNNDENEKNKNTSINTVFLMNGEWFILNDKYLETIDEQFKDFYINNNASCDNYPVIKKIENRKKINSKLKTENDYNYSFKNELDNNIIVTHPVLIDKVEFADLISWDEDNIYFICVKDKFDASGVRDLTNQMWVSARLFHSIYNSSNRIEKLTLYHTKILKNYIRKYSIVQELENNDLSYIIENYPLNNKLEIKKHLNIIDKTSNLTLMNSQKFIKLFEKKPVYIAGYIDGYKKKSTSNYAKLLTIDYKNIFKQELGIEYLVSGNLMEY